MNLHDNPLRAWRRLLVCVTASLILGITAFAHADDSEAQRVTAIVKRPATSLLADAGPLFFSGDVPAGTRTDLVDVKLAGEPAFTSARRIVVGQHYDQPYNVQVFSEKTTAAIAKGDTLLASCWLRLGDGENVGSADVGLVTIRMQLTREPWFSPANTDITLDRTWRRVYIAGVMDRDFPAGDLNMVVHVGHQPQVIEVGPCAVLNLGQGVDVKSLPYNKLDWPGRAADAPWRAEAQKRIERYRMGDLTIRVTDADGNPLAGAKVTIKQKSRAFGIGSFATAETLLANSPDGDKTRDIFSRLFNRATTPIYFADWGWPKQREQFLAVAKWLTDHNMITRGHVMIYPNYTILPKDVVALKDEPQKMRERLLQQIADISEATKPFNFREYDVTNELRDSVDVHQLLGRDVVADWFAEARKHLPYAKLANNENVILTVGGVAKRKQDLYLDWHQFLKSKGHPPDVIGFQAHFNEAVTSPERVWAILDRFANETEAELQITEFDIATRDEISQADYTRDFLTACFAHPRVTGFTMWGFWEGDHWLPEAAFWRRDWSPKPNAKMLETLLTKTWWTDTTAETGADGTATIKVFLGEHTVTVSADGKERSMNVIVREPAMVTSQLISLDR